MRDYEKYRKYYLQYLSWDEIVKHTEKDDIIILPIGSIEQHGHHLPVGDDSLNAQVIAELVAERTNVLIAPPIWYGALMYFQHGFKGSIHIRADILKQYVMDVVRGLVSNGFNKIIILNAHGQQWVLIGALQELALETGAFIAIATWWELAIEKIREVTETGMHHAGEAETSVALAYFPELVKMDKAVKEMAPTVVDRRFFGGPSIILKGQFPHHNITAFFPQVKTHKYGVVGDATKASAEKGKAMIEAAVNKIVELIEELRRRYPPGIKPLEVSPRIGSQ